MRDAWIGLASAAHIVKLEWCSEDQHGPCSRMTSQFVKCSILKKISGQKYWNWVHSAMSNISL